MYVRDVDDAIYGSTSFVHSFHLLFIIFALLVLPSCSEQQQSFSLLVACPSSSMGISNSLLLLIDPYRAACPFHWQYELYQLENMNEQVWICRWR